MGNLRAVLRPAAILVVTLGFAHARAWACSCIQTTAADAVASGDAIVVAQITEVRQPGGCGGDSTIHATVEVREVIAGPGTTGALEVQTNTTDGACGLDLVAGETWVLQVFGDEQFVSLCTASRAVESDDDPWVAELRGAAAAE